MEKQIGVIVGMMNDDLMNGVVKKSSPNPTNWQFSELITSALTSAKDAKLPRMFSLREKFPPCYKQIYKNCTTNAVLACDAYYYHNPKGSWIPSTTFTWWLQRKEVGDEKRDVGSSVEVALDMVRKYGVCNSTVWANDAPYNKKPSKEAFTDGLKGKELTKYYQVKNLTQIKKALVKGYPVAAALCWAFKSIDGNSWIFNTPTKTEVKKCHSGHAIVIVGYNDELELFEIRNSRGTEWGDNGYGYITYEAMKRCIWYDDSYAVVK